MAEWFVVGLLVFVVGGFIAAYARRRAREDIVIHAPAERIWSIITNYRHLPEWQPETEAVALEPDGRGWTETHKDGLRYRYHVEDSEAPRRIRWRYQAIFPGDEPGPVAPAAGGGRGAGGAWTLTLEPQGNDCRVRSRVVDRRSGSLWSRTLNALRGPRSHQGMYLECLKARVEAEAPGPGVAPASA
jgi:uncharacterized protein YndB with AHSA1/START domain